MRLLKVVLFVSLVVIFFILFFGWVVVFKIKVVFESGLFWLFVFLIINFFLVLFFGMVFFFKILVLSGICDK